MRSQRRQAPGTQLGPPHALFPSSPYLIGLVAKVPHGPKTVYECIYGGLIVCWMQRPALSVFKVQEKAIAALLLRDYLCPLTIHFIKSLMYDLWLKYRRKRKKHG